MRFVYIDEAGTSANEPATVVCAAIVHADKQLVPTVNALRQLVDAVIPEQHRNGYIFHGKEIINGSPAFPRKDFTLDQRLEILAHVNLLHLHFDIPLVIAYSRRTFAHPGPPNTQQNVEANYLSAFCRCIAGVSAYMRLNCPDEVALIISENSNLIRNYIKKAPAFLRSPEFIQNAPRLIKPHLPITNLVGPVYFAEKTEEPLLQISDAAAFSFRRYISGKYGGDKLVEVLTEGNMFVQNHPSNELGQVILRPQIDVNGRVTQMPPSFYIDLSEDPKK